MKYEDLLYSNHKIESLWLVLTYNCQFQCEWCYTRNGSIQNDLKLEDALDACRLLSQLGGKNIILIGGEPLIYPNQQLIKIIKECKKLNLNTILITNGYSLENEQNIVFLKNAGLNRLTLSLKRNKCHYFESTVKDKRYFQEVEKYISNLNKYQLSYEISCLIDFRDTKVYKDIMYWTSRIESPQIIFQTYVPPTGSNTSPKSIPLPKESVRIIIELYKISLKMSEICCHFSFQYPFCLFGKDILKSMLNDDVLFGSHEVLFMGRGFAIDPSGYILPSSHWVGFPLFHLDEIREEGYLSHKKFLNKWNSEDIINFRKKLWTNLSYASERCEVCELWSSRCLGGNPLVWKVWDEKELLP